MYTREHLINIELEVLPIAVDLTISETYDAKMNQYTKDVSFKSNDNAKPNTLGFGTGYYPVIDELVIEGLIELSQTKFIYNTKTKVIIGEYQNFKFVVGECYDIKNLKYFKEIPRFENIRKIKFS